MGGDFNGHIGVEADGYARTHRGFGFGDRNSRGVALVDFAIAFDLTIVNSLFKKREDHLVTFRSESCKTQINFFLIRANHRRLCKNCKVIPSEYLGSQHKLLVMDLVIKNFKVKKRGGGIARIRWWNLTRENVTKLSEKIESETNWELVRDANAMWERMAQCIRRSAKEILGVSRGGGGRRSGTWWWDEQVREKVKKKQKTYTALSS